MRGYIWAFLFISLTYMSTKSNIDRIGDPSRMWAIIKNFESGLEFCSKILQRYSIWIFHCTIYTLLFATELTYVSILLCFMELIIFPIQLYGWLRTKEKRNTMVDDENKIFSVKEQVYITIERSWRYLYKIIIVNAVYKYLTFFARYVTIRHGFGAFFDLFMSKKFMVFLMDWNNTQVDALQKDFFFEAVLLIMGFYTNNCVITNATKEMMDSSNGLASLGENLVELAEIAEKKDISEYRHTTTFTTMLLILKGFTFLFIGFHTMKNTNAFKVLLLLLPLIYYNVLFVKINKSIDLYKIRDMITNYLVYFFKNFASNVKVPDPKNTPGALPDLPSGLSRDVVHYEAYFSQFLKQMENDIVTLSEKFWPYFFHLWLAYSLILIVIRILLQYGAELTLFFKYFGLFYSNGLESTPSAQERNRILQSEQLGNQVIFAFLIVEFLVIHYYLSLPMNIEPMADVKVKQMVDMMESKFKLYTTTEKDIRKKIDEMDEEAEENEEDQPFKETFSRVDRIKAINMHFKRLKEQYAEDVMMLEGTTHTEREEMTRFIRVRENATEDIAFRGLKFSNEPQKPDLLISESELNGRFAKQSALSKNGVIREENEDQDEYRPRGETSFVVNTKSVIENLQLLKPKLDANGNDPHVVGLVVKHFMLVEEDNEQYDKELGDHHFKEEGFKELHKKDEEKEKHILIYMDQQTSTQIKVLYKERNTHMFHLGRLLNSLSYVTGRLMILPLLYSLGDKTAVNIFILFVTATYIFRFNVGSFEKQMKIYMPIFTVVIFVESFLQYLASIEPLKDKLKTFVRGDSSSEVTMFHSSFYRLWLITIACIGYASIIWTAKFIFAHLFVIRQRVTDIFFSYSLEDCKIEVDFTRWKHYQWMLTTLMSNEVYAQLNDIYITCTIIYCLINSSKRILLLIMILMFGYNIFMRIRKSFNTLAMEEQAVINLRFIIKIVVVCLFLLEFMIQLMSIILILLNKSDNVEQTQNLWTYMLKLLSRWSVIGSHFMIIVSLLFYDLLRVDNYVVEKRKFVKFSELKMKFSDLCEAQSTNEKKMYERVLIMIANERLQAQIDEFLTNKDSNSKRLKLTASLNYHNMDIKEDLKNNRYEYLSKYVDNVRLMKIKATEAFFNGLLNHCNQYIQQDMLYLLSKVCHIDQGILETNSFNLTNYLSGDYNILENIYTQIVSFYANLFNKEDNEFTIYKAKIDVFEDNIQSFAKYGKYVESRKRSDTFDRKRDPDSINSPDMTMSPGLPCLRDSFGINSALMGRKESTISRNTFMLMEDENTPSAICNLKRSERLKPAIEIFANELFRKRPLSNAHDIYNSRGSAKFKLSEENCSIIFHNIKRDSMAMTLGYTKLNPLEIVKILLCLVWSHIETIISLAIIFVLYLNGGMLSIIIIGILFFRILVEERGGPILYWELVNAIFFIQFVCKIFTSSFTQVDVKSVNVAIAWISILGGITEDRMATYDAFVQILIMWLIHHINKKNINLPKGKKLVTPGVAIARVDFLDLVHHGGEVVDAIHGRDQQRKT